MTKPVRNLICAACLALPVILIGCGRRDLGDGYELVEEYSGAVFLAREGTGTGVPICSHIPRAKSNSRYVVGYHQKPEPIGEKPLHKCDWEDLGYFVVIKETGELETELTGEELMDRCSQLDINICQKIIE